MTVQDFQLRVANKTPCRVATTANIATLAGGAPDTVDGVNLAAGDRVLVKDQSTGSQNGIYQVDTLGTGSNGVWSRVLDMDDVTDDAIQAGLNTYIQEGTANEKKTFYLTTTGTITLGSTSLTFEEGPTAGAGGGVGGSTGATDNALLRADGTGGSTVQSSGVTLDDSDNLDGVVSVNMPEQATAPVTPGAGEGAFWVKPTDGAVDTTIPMFTDEDGEDMALVRSVELERSMPSSSGDSVELGTITTSNGQVLGIAVFGGAAASSDYVAFHRVVLRNAATTGGFQILRPLYTSGPTDGSTFNDKIQVEIDVAVGGTITLRVRSYLGVAGDIRVRLIFEGDDRGVFSSSSTQATTTPPTDNFNTTMLTMTESLGNAGGPAGIVAWKPHYLEERSSADSDVAGYGQLWVRDDSPNVLVFTDDTGTDRVLGGGTPITQTNVVYVSKAGNDSDDGLTVNTPKLTIGSAVTAAGTLLPGISNRVTIYIMDGGTYAESVTLQNYVSLIGPGATVEGAVNSFAMNPGTESRIVLNRIVGSTGTIGGAVRTSDPGKCWIEVNELICLGTGSTVTCFINNGATTEAFLDVGHMTVSVGRALQLSSTGTISGNIGTIEVTSTGVGVYCSAAGEVSLEIGEIIESATATMGIDMQISGSVANIVIGQLATTNSYEVATGATLNLIAGDISGTPGTVSGTANVTVAGEGIGGSTGSTDNAILRADGTGGSTAQASQVTVGDTGLIANAIGVGLIEQSTSPNPGAGNGLFWVKNDAPSSPMFTDDTNVPDRILVGKAVKPASNVTLADDVTWVSVVSVTLEANTFYSFALNILYQVTATDDIEFRFTQTSTAATIFSEASNTTTYIHGDVVQLNTSGALEMASLNGSMVGGGSGGTITLEARKQTDAGSDGTVDEETYLVLTRIE